MSTITRELNRFRKQMNKSNLKICVVDQPGGSYLNVAIKLAPYFEKTFYHSINQSAFPHPALSQIGTGYEQIERIDNFWSSLDEFDIVIFGDGGFLDWGNVLRKMGKMVWGGSNGETLESSRSLFQSLLERVDLPTAPTQIVLGLNNLKKALKTKKNKWIKVSKWRNLIETYNWIDYTSSKFWLDELTFKLGPLGDQEQLEFIIQDPIDSIAEIGCDGYCINGQMPSNLIFGMEIKDCGYIGKISKDIPSPIKEVNDKFAPVLKAYSYNGFYSTEIRYTENKLPYYTDICSRAGSPPSSSVLSNISNWDEIIPAACKGEFVEPKYRATYMVEIIIKSNYCNTNYLPVTFPPEFEDNITFKGAFKVDGKVFIVPFPLAGFDMVEFGSVVVQDNDLDSAINRALIIADSIKAYELRYEMAALDIAKETITKVEEAIQLKF